MLLLIFQIFELLVSLLQTLRGVSLLPIHPVAIFILLILWNILKFSISKSYKPLLIYLALLSLIIFLFSGCLKRFLSTGDIAARGCAYYLIFSLIILSITSLLSIAFIIFYFFTIGKNKFQTNPQMMLYITAIFTYLDSFYLRASKDEILFLVTASLAFFIVFKNFDKLKTDYIYILAITILFLFINSLTNSFAIFKPEILNGKINFINMTEYILIELISFLFLWRKKDNYLFKAFS